MMDGWGLQKRANTSSTASDESEIVELSDGVVHDGRGVAHFSGQVFVVAGSQYDRRAVSDFAESNDRERRRK